MYTMSDGLWSMTHCNVFHEHGYQRKTTLALQARELGALGISMNGRKRIWKGIVKGKTLYAQFSRDLDENV